MRQFRTIPVVLNFPCTREFNPLLFKYYYRADGVMRTMAPEKLLKSMPILQGQIDALLEFDVCISSKSVSCIINIVFPLKVSCMQIQRFLGRQLEIFLI